MVCRLLDTVTTQVTHHDGSGWLGVSRTGTGNQQTLDNEVVIAGLAVGTFTATVAVSAANDPGSPRS